MVGLLSKPSCLTSLNDWPPKERLCFRALNHWSVEHLISTWMGKCLGVPGAVDFFFLFLICILLLIFY